MATNGASQRLRGSSLSRTASPKSFNFLSSEFQRLQDRVFMEFQDFTRITYDFKDSKEACKALFVQNKELFSKILQLTATVKSSGSAISTLKLKSENIDLTEKLRSYSELIVKLSNENDYYAKHIENLLNQLRILKGDPKRPQGPKLKLAELQEQLIVKEEEIRLMQEQLQTRGKVSLDARTALARAETLQTRLNAELAEKELQKFSQQEFLGHMHTQAKAIEKLMAEVSNPSGFSDYDPQLQQQAAELRSRNASLTQQLDIARKQLSKLSSSSKRPFSSALNPKQRAAMEEINDLFALNELAKAAEKWKELDYTDLPMESGERTCEMLREVLRMRDAAISRFQRRKVDPGDESLLEMIREKDAEIDVLKNTLLGGPDSNIEASSLRSKVRVLTEELRQKENELQEVLEDKEDSPRSDTAQGLQLALRRKDQELRVLLDELVELRRSQEPAEAFRTAISERNAKILRLETELGLFRGSSDAVSHSIEAVLGEFANKARGRDSEELIQETAERLKKIGLKQVSDKLVDDVESKMKLTFEKQVDEMRDKIQSLETAVGKFRRLLEEEKAAHSDTIMQMSVKTQSTKDDRGVAESTEKPLTNRDESDSTRSESALLARKVAQLTQELERVRSNETPSLGGKDTSGKVVKEHLERIKELQDEVTTLKERIYDMDFEEKTKEIDVQKTMEEKENALISAKSDLEKLIEINKAMKDAEKRLSEECDNLKKAANEQKSRCESMNEELDDRKLELARIYKQLDSAFSELKTNKESSEEEIAGLKAKLTEKSDQIEDLSEQVKALTSEIQQQDEHSGVAELTQASNRLISVIKTTLPSLFTIPQGRPEASLDVEAVAHEAVAVADLLSKPNSANIDIGSPIDRFESALTRCETLLQSLSPLSDDAKATLIAENLALERRLAAQSVAVSDQDAKPSNSEDISKWAIAKWQSAEDELIRLKSDLSEVKHELKMTEKEDFPSSGRQGMGVKSLQSDLKKAKRTISDLQRDASDREKRSDVESLKIDLRSAEVNRLELEQTVTRLQSELEYVQTQLKRCVMDSETKESAWKQALARLKDLVKARFDLEKQPIVLLDPYVNPLAFLETLSSEFQDLNKRKAAERDKITRVLSDFQEAKQAWNDKEEELHGMLQTANKEKVTLEMTVQSLQNQLSGTRQELNIAKETVARVESALSDRPTEEQLRESFEKGRLAGFSEAKRSEKSELDAENKKLQSLLKDYKDSLEEAKRKWKETQERLSTTARLNSEMTGQLQEMTRELEAEHEEKVRLGADLQGKSEFFERLMRDVENTKQFYHK